MDKLIPVFYKEYGNSINTWRALPHLLDGLKPIERRVLISAYDVCKDKFVKSVKVDSYCVGNFSPHGTCYGTIVNLKQNGFLLGQGNFGSDLGIDSEPPAAMRYTEISSNPFILKLAFQLIKYIPTKRYELEVEPVFLPTMIPFCLMGIYPTQGVGFGYKTYCPNYNIFDLYKRLLYLLGISKEKPTIKPFIKNCEILSTEEELEELLITGKAKIKVKGVAQYDFKHHIIILRSWPPTRSFSVFLNKFRKELEAGEIGWNDQSSKKNGGTYIKFELVKQKNKVDIFQKIVEKFEECLVGYISYDCVVVDLQNIPKTTSIDTMLMTTFSMYKQVNEKALKDDKQKLEELSIEYNNLLKLRNYLSKYIKDISITKLDSILSQLSNDCGIEINIIKDILSKYSIKKLFEAKLDIDDLKNKIDIIDNNFKNIQKFVLSKYNELLGIGDKNEKEK